MSKLVDEPIDAAPFLPVLMPALAYAADAMSDPEARTVAENATKQLQKLQEESEKAKLSCKIADHALVKAAVLELIAVPPGTNIEVFASHLAHLCCSLMSLKRFEAERWQEIETYVKVVTGDATSAAVTEALRVRCKEMMRVVPTVIDDGDDAEE
eukprot:gene24721-31664_t